MIARSAPEVRGSSTSAAHARTRLAPQLRALQLLACLTAFLSAHAAADPPRQLAPSPPQDRPGFALESLDGTTVALGALRGTPVLVHFFATWCEPCKAEFETLAKFAARRPDIKILAIDVGEIPSRVRRFAEAERITLPILLDGDRKLTRSWGVTILPTTFVLDATHTARLFVEGDLDWDSHDTVSAIDAAIPAEPEGTRPSKQPERRPQ